jgi:hypothetical protein
MTFLPRRNGAAALALLLSLAAAPPTPGLVSFNQGRDEVHLALHAGATWDSNLYSNSASDGDFVLNAGAAAEYARRAGLIGLDATLGADAAWFTTYDEENYVNPHGSVELTKATGRTTGSLRGAIARLNRADVAANQRARLWDSDYALKVRYPVISRYSLSGSLGFNRQDYIDNPLLVDLDTFTASGDLFYSYNTQRDFLVGYRYRRSASALDSISRDHAFTGGIAGKITAKINGTVRAGYQTRSTSAPAFSEDDAGVFAAVAATWTANRRTALSGQISRDFSTTSTDIGSEGFAATLELKTTHNGRLSSLASATYGTLDFIGNRGAGRSDTYLILTAGITLTLREQIRLAFTYTHLDNWSTLAAADYSRDAFSVSVNSRF